jgi:hypothetical protein
MADLRALVSAAGENQGMCCLKDTGDGYLFTFYNIRSAAQAVVQAIKAIFKLLLEIERRNMNVPDELKLYVRLALHIGEVDVVPGDRKGPHVSYTFRLASIRRDSQHCEWKGPPAELLPLANFVVCSEEVENILKEHSELWDTLPIGRFKLEGFPGWREVYRVLPAAADEPVELPLAGVQLRSRS